MQEIKRNPRRHQVIRRSFGVKKRTMRENHAMRRPKPNDTKLNMKITQEIMGPRKSGEGIAYVGTGKPRPNKTNAHAMSIMGPV